jgi:hypothetical protein
MKIDKVNNVCVKPVIVQDNNEAEKIKGFKIIPFAFYNMFICSKKKSGKTSLINTIIRKTTDKRTNVWVFCSTFKIDDSWKAIINYLEEKGNKVNTFDSIFDGKVNLLNKILDEMGEPEDIPEKKDKKAPINLNEIKRSYDLFGKETDEKGEPKKEYIPKKRAPKHLFIFDDLSPELKHIDRLLKVHRHFKASVIISSQYIHDLSISSRLQIDVFCTFRGFSQEKLEMVHKSLDLSIPFDTLWCIYKHITEEPYQFLYVNVRTEEIRKSLNSIVKYDE